MGARLISGINAPVRWQLSRPLEAGLIDEGCQSIEELIR